MSKIDNIASALASGRASVATAKAPKKRRAAGRRRTGYKVGDKVQIVGAGETVRGAGPGPLQGLRGTVTQVGAGQAGQYYVALEATPAEILATYRRAGDTTSTTADMREWYGARRWAALDATDLAPR